MPKRSSDERLSKSQRTISESNKTIAHSRGMMLNTQAAIRASEARQKRQREHLEKKAA